MSLYSILLTKFEQSSVATW